MFPEATGDYDDDVVAVEAYTLVTGGQDLWWIVLTSPKTIVEVTTLLRNVRS